MTKRSVLAIAACAAAAAIFPLARQHAQTRRTGAIPMRSETAFRVLLGVGDTAPSVWDGGVQVTGGRVLSIKGWRFAAGDNTDYRTSWKASTRRGAPAGARARSAGRPGPIEENGVIIGAVLNDPAARFDIRTTQGSFSFRAADVPFGGMETALDGRVRIDRVPATLQLTTSDEEEDFPALACRGDDVWLSYVQFVHGDRSQAGQRQLRTEPRSFDYLARPAGGDQVFLLHYSQSKRTWDPAIPVSDPGQDVMRTAVAVDAAGRVWVFWSARRNDNFDIYAKTYAGGKSSSELRLTSDPGTDLNPVAATDSAGRVWLAWQGYRGTSLDILAAVQAGDGFAPEQVVSTSRASDWDPAIAAAPNGTVAVAWDTYDKGDYDVYFRLLRAAEGLRMDPPVVAAASPGFEARASLAFDAANRLWLAYEASASRWGKDFGAYETTGVALYQGHNVQVRCFQNGKPYAPSAHVSDALPGAPAPPQRRPGRRRASAPAPPAAGVLPDPALARNRAPSATPQPPALPLNSFPRLAVDPDGMLYLAVRTPAGGGRSPVGSVWFENVLYFDGRAWTGPIFVPRSDGLLDSRPALTALAPGRLLIAMAMDHRHSQVTGGGRRGAEGINTDVYAADLRLDARPAAPELRPIAPEEHAPAPEALAEAAQASLMRDYRVRLGSATYRLLRGEFHRHTEISGDGGRDGPLIDAYRYLIDAAAMDWGGCCDHDNGGGREYYWWLQQKLTDAYRLGPRFVPMFSYERSVRYPEGHRNVVFARRGIRPLPRLPKVPDDAPLAPAPDTQMLYRYLKRFEGIAASHTSATDMGTDWRDNDPLLEPVVEIYQGDRQNYEMPGAPRANTAADSIGGWRPLGFVSLALQKGYRLGFQASSDHISTHMSYCNLWVSEPTREAIMEAFRARRVYGATDNILADVRCGNHFMGEEFETAAPPALTVKLRGTAPFAKVHVVKDNRYVYTTEPKTRDVQFTWRDAAARKGTTSYYYVRGEQADGELVWVSPMWIRYR